MLLAVDIGNTQTHLGAFEGETLVEHWRFQTRSGATGDELAERDRRPLLALRDVVQPRSTRVCVSSVVPPLGVQFERLGERYLEAECLTIGPGVKTGMPIRIENPLEVGADRLVNSIAAYERFGEACVVVDFGTGINIDVVSADGRVPRRRDRPRPRALPQRPDRARRADHADGPRRARARRSGARPGPRSTPASSSASPG